MFKRTKGHADVRLTDKASIVTEWVQLLCLATSCYNVGTIWMTQLGYRLWAQVKQEDFEKYHRAWWFGWKGIQPIVFPAGTVATIGSIAQLRWRSRHVSIWLVWFNITLHLQSWLLTAVLWAPLQARLQRARQEDGSFDPMFKRLLTTHWLRVGLFTACGFLQFWIAVKSFLIRD